MQQLRRFLVPIILLLVAILFLLVFSVAYLRSDSATGDAASASASGKSGGFFSNLLPAAAGPATLTPAPAAPLAAPTLAPAALPTAVLPAPVGVAPAATLAPVVAIAPAVPAAPVVQQVTPVPAIDVRGNAGTNNGNGSVITGADTGDAGGVSCGTRVIHILKPGENLFRLGLRYNTTASAIARLNGITNVRNISSGRRLVIVACARGAGRSNVYYSSRSGTYIVRTGDTLFGIASRFGVNVQYLCRANGLYTSLIVPGQVLVIP